jgi:hypothetical protein
MGWAITIKHWHGVAEWTWNKGDDDVCGICRFAAMPCMHMLLQLAWRIRVGRVSMTPSNHPWAGLRTTAVRLT